MKESKAYQVSEDVLFQQVSGELVLLDLKQESYFGANALGAQIWALLETGASVPDIVERLQSEYDVSPEILAADVEAFVGELLAQGLVAISDSTEQTST